MQHADVIDRLGGYRAVAEALGENPTTVQNWRRRGIPGRFWPAIARLATKRGHPEITVDVLAGLPAEDAA